MTSPSSPCYLICVSADGIPLFCRVKGALESLPFARMGSINAVHMFADNHNAKLINTTTANSRTFWRQMNDNIKLIAVNFDACAQDSHLTSLFDHVFNAMVMIVGLQALEEVQNVDRLKKQLKLCFPFIDALLTRQQLFGDITCSPDVILCQEMQLMQSYLDSFAAACNSEFGCLLLHGKIIVGTEKWWQLVPMETMLIMFLVQSMPWSSAKDVPIYLPHGSPNVPHRLVTLSLIDHIQVVLICGPEPSLQSILSNYVTKYWTPVLDTLTLSQRCYPRCFPPDVKLDSNLLAFIIVNTEDFKCLASLHPQGSMTGSDLPGLKASEQRKQILLSFFYSVDSQVLQGLSKASADDDQNADAASHPISSPLRSPHTISETYHVTRFHKCCAKQTSHHVIYAVYSSDIPTYALGGVTLQVLRRLTKDKFI